MSQNNSSASSFDKDRWLEDQLDKNIESLVQHGEPDLSLQKVLKAYLAKYGDEEGRKNLVEGLGFSP